MAGSADNAVCHESSDDTICFHTGVAVETLHSLLSKEIHAGIQFQIEVKGQEGDFRGQIIFRGKSARDEVEMIFFQGQMFSGCPALNIILLIPGRGGYQNKNIPRKNTDLMEIQIFTGNMVKGDLVRMIVETKRCPIDQDHESVFRS